MIEAALVIATLVCLVLAIVLAVTLIRVGTQNMDIQDIETKVDQLTTRFTQFTDDVNQDVAALKQQVASLTANQVTQDDLNKVMNGLDGVSQKLEAADSAIKSDLGQNTPPVDGTGGASTPATGTDGTGGTGGASTPATETGGASGNGGAGTDTTG